MLPNSGGWRAVAPSPDLNVAASGRQANARPTWADVLTPPVDVWGRGRFRESLRLSGLSAKSLYNNCLCAAAPDGEAGARATKIFPKKYLTNAICGIYLLLEYALQHIPVVWFGLSVVRNGNGEA